MATTADLAALGMRPVVLPEDLRLLQSESSLQRQVTELAELSGWAVYHTADSRRSNPGFPDLVLVRGSQLIFAELKAIKGRVSRAQERWLGLLGAVPGITVRVWRPDNWSEIEATLRETPRVAANDRGRHRIGGSNAAQS